MFGNTKRRILFIAIAGGFFFAISPDILVALFFWFVSSVLIIALTIPKKPIEKPDPYEQDYWVETTKDKPSENDT